MDPNRIGVFGNSSGGHLALLLGTTGDSGNPSASDPVADSLERRRASVASRQERDVAGAHRVFYVATRAEATYVLHAFEKKTQKTSARDLRIGRDRFGALRKLGQQHGKEERG